MVLNSLGRGGAEKSILSLACEFIRRGIPVSIVLMSSLPNEYPVPPELDGRIVRLEAGSFPAGVLKLLAQLARRRPDRLMTAMPQASAAGSLVGLLLGIPAYVTERTTPLHFYGNGLKLWVALAPHVLGRRSLFISRYALESGLPQSFISRGIRRKAVVVHNPVQTPIPLEQASALRRSRLTRLRQWASGGTCDGGPLTLALASRLVQGKGIPEVIAACQGMLRDGRVRLEIYGEGAMRSEIVADLARRGLQDAVALRGFQPDMRAAYGGADVVLLPSQSEGFGRVGFEAYLSGCFVVGLPRNSFVGEVLTSAPAWRIADGPMLFEAAVRSFGEQSLPTDDADLQIMASRLSISEHAEAVLDFLEWVPADA